MNSIQLTTSLLYLLGSITTLIIVATWPQVKGKGWLLGALSILVATRLCFPLMYVVGFVYGQNEVHSILRDFGWVTQFANVIGVALLVVAVVELRGCLNGRASSKTTLRRNVLHAAPWVPGITVCVGMSLPWAYMRGRWVSGWSTSANILGLELPGFVIAIAAGITIVALVARSDDSKKNHHWCALLLCGYGLLHSIFMAIALTNTPGMDVGSGVLVTIVGLLILSFCSVSFHPQSQLASATSNARAAV